MNKKELIVEVLEGLTDSELFSIGNEYKREVDAFDDEIYTIEDLDMFVEGQDAYWLACRIYYGDFRPTADYFKFDGYGNLKSIESYELSDYIEVEEIAGYCVENNKAFYNDDIQEILDSEDEETEEK